MKPIIGLDFGNYNSLTCYISDFDIGTRIGGIVHDLLPPRRPDGIPSIYFFSEKLGVLCGEEAERQRAIPLQNRLRYLKRHLGESITIDGKNILYDNAITEVIQYCIRSANKELKDNYLVTTNLVSVSYPATYTSAQRQRLIELIERGTLEDGTPLKVFGTIAEPAAAALDYLSEFVKTKSDTTVLVYDLGGGTFDLGLVSAYPKGKKNSKGDTYYYDIIDTRGIAKLGGIDFDDIVYNILYNQLNCKLNENQLAVLRNLAETVKIELSDADNSYPSLWNGEEDIEFIVTRKEFEDAAKDLVIQTINATKEVLDEHKENPPEVILLTGGASQMPMIKKELEKAFPSYNGKIIFFRPSKAIAYGAARFGTSEPDVVQQRTMYDLGVRYVNDMDDTIGYIHTYIKAGTPLPYESKFVPSKTLKDGESCCYCVFEAKQSQPDYKKPHEDYTEIMCVTLEYGRTVPKGTPNESRMCANELGILKFEVREVGKEKIFESKVELKNLS